MIFWDMHTNFSNMIPFIHLKAEKHQKKGLKIKLLEVITEVIDLEYENFQNISLAYV